MAVARPAAASTPSRPATASAAQPPGWFSNPLGRIGWNITEGAKSQIFAALGGAGAAPQSPTAQQQDQARPLLERLGKCLQSDQLDVDNAREIISQLKALNLSEAQQKAVTEVETALGVQSRDPKAVYESLLAMWDQNQGEVSGFLSQAKALFGGTGGGGPLYDMLMGSPTPSLGNAQKALEDLKSDLQKPNRNLQLLATAKQAITELLASDAKIKEALKGKKFNEEEAAALTRIQTADVLTQQDVETALKALKPYIDEQHDQGIVSRVMRLGQGALGEALPKYVMGRPEKLLGEVQKALAALSDALGQPQLPANIAELAKAAKSSIQALLEKPEVTKKALRDESFTEQEALALVAVRDADELTPELVTAALEVVNKYCEMQRRDGLLPHAWGAAEEAAFRTLKEVAKGINPPLSEEDKLAQFVTEFCERGFADPTPPFVASSTIDTLQGNFILATANFSVKELGPTTRKLLLSWVHWYIGGFVKNIHNAFMGYFNAGIPEEQFALKEAICTHAKAFLQPLHKHIAAKTPYDKVAAECEMNRLAGTIIDQFAPRFQLHVRVSRFFQRWPVIFAPFSWVFQGVAFILDGIANGITLPLMKWVIARNRIVPMLLDEIKKSMGIGPGQEYPYNLQRILCDRLNDGLTELQRGGIPAPYVPSERLKRGVKDVVTELVPLLDRVAHAGGVQLTEVPEALLDQFASRDLVETLVVQIARLFHFALTPTNMDEWMSKLYTALTECYTPSSPVDLATKKRMEKDFMFTKKKLIFLSIFFAVEEKMLPEIAARRQAARFLFSVKNKLLSDSAGLTPQWAGELSDRVLNPQAKKLAQPCMEIIAKNQADAEALKKWAQDFNPLAVLEVPPLDPDSAIGQIVRLTYKRYEPLTGSLLKLITDGTLIEAIFDPPFIDPILGN